MCSSVLTGLEAREVLALPFNVGTTYCLRGKLIRNSLQKVALPMQNPANGRTCKTLKCRSEACRGVMTAVIALR